MRSVQGTKQQLVTVCRRYSAYTLLAAGMVALAACGGGGGSAGISDPVNPSNNTTSTVTPAATVVADTDTTPLNPRYTGKRELAVLTEAAALDFLELGKFGKASPSVGPPIAVFKETPLMFSSGTVDCDASGKVSRTAKESLSDDGLSKTYLSQFTYDKCRGLIAAIDGSTGFTRTETYGSPITLTETDNYNLTVINFFANGNITEVYDGSTSLNKIGVKLSADQNIYIKEGNSEVLRVNLQRFGAIGETQGTITEMSGRIYLGDYGYVTPKVLQPLSFNEWQISTGELILMGANNSKAQILPTSSETFVLNTDENGDGGYEKTRIVNWADL